jgi:hypothetical protein
MASNKNFIRINTTFLLITDVHLNVGYFFWKRLVMRKCAVSEGLEFISLRIQIGIDSLEAMDFFRLKLQKVDKKRDHGGRRTIK